MIFTLAEGTTSESGLLSCYNLTESPFQLKTGTVIDHENNIKKLMAPSQVTSPMTVFSYWVTIEDRCKINRYKKNCCCLLNHISCHLPRLWHSALCYVDKKNKTEISADMILMQSKQKLNNSSEN